MIGNILLQINPEIILSIVSSYTRSIILHLNEILVYLNKIPQTFDIIILTETWLSVDLSFNINGYKIYHYLGFLNKGDGVNIFIKHHLIITYLNINIVTDCNSIEFNFKFNVHNYKIIDFIDHQV